MEKKIYSIANQCKSALQPNLVFPCSNFGLNTHQHYNPVVRRVMRRLPPTLAEENYMYTHTHTHTHTHPQDIGAERAESADAAPHLRSRPRSQYSRRTRPQWTIGHIVGVAALYRDCLAQYAVEIVSVTGHVTSRHSKPLSGLAGVGGCGTSKHNRPLSGLAGNAGRRTILGVAGHYRSWQTQQAFRGSIRGTAGQGAGAP